MSILKKSATELAKEYDWDIEYDYFNYIIDSYENGQHTQCLVLYNNMTDESRLEFMKNYINRNSKCFTYLLATLV